MPKIKGKRGIASVSNVKKVNGQPLFSVETDLFDVINDDYLDLQTSKKLVTPKALKKGKTK